MERIRVLIVDDSIVYRSLLKASLDNLDFIEVVGVASNGRIALEKLKVSKIDLVILDLEMPEMNGISLLKEMKNKQIISKVILFSSQTHNGAQITLEGLSLGASDFAPKPQGSMSEANPQDRIRSLLLPKIRSLFNYDDSVRPDVFFDHEKKISESFWSLYRPKVIVIGSSTGGPQALESVFSKLKGPLRCPIVIAQHMPPVFTASLAEKIQKITGIPTSEAKDREELKNQIYIAPGDYHLRLGGTKVKPYFTLDQSELINFVRPAVDPLFMSAADIFREGCLGIVLTGMGHDGRDGALRIKNNQGFILIQNEESCVVFGMPGAVKAQGCFDWVKNLEELADILVDKAQV